MTDSSDGTINKRRGVELMSSKTELMKGKKVEIKPGYSGYLALPDAKRAPGMIVIKRSSA